ncbi:MAG: radical SAM protein [Tindallia sp. MSAO_Bac2]|nr:MAG: radical SAM protein [Tindallia sp. MSAO_Bac2]
MKSKMQETLIYEYLYGKNIRPKNPLNELGYQIEFKEQQEIRKIYLEITDRCNLNCSICYRKSWEDMDYDRDMTDETLEKVYRDLDEIEGIQKIVIGGIGEPFYHPKITEIIKRLEKYPLHITTNGTLLTEEIIEALTGTVQEITVSIDGVGEAFCDIRGISLDGIVKGIRALQKKSMNRIPRILK